MKVNEQNIPEIERRLHEIEGELRVIRSTVVPPRSWLHRALGWLRNNYGFISFLLLGAAAGYYALRYQVTPFHDLADPARSRALARTYTALGDRMMAAGRWDHARAAYDESLKLDPRDARASYHAHIAGLMVLDDPAADAALRQLAPETMDDPVVPFAQGILSARRRQYATAAEYFRRSIAVDSAFIGAHINLGVVSLQTGDRATYLGQARKAYVLDSNFDIAINNMAYAFGLEHKFGEAERLYLRLDTVGRTARTTWLAGSAMLYRDAAAARGYLERCMRLVEQGLPDTAAELGDDWAVSYIPLDTAAQIGASDIVTVRSSVHKAACVRVPYAVCDAIAGNERGARMKLERALADAGSHPGLRRVLAAQLRAYARFAARDTAVREFLEGYANVWNHAGNDQQ